MRSSSVRCFGAGGRPALANRGGGFEAGRLPADAEAVLFFNFAEARSVRTAMGRRGSRGQTGKSSLPGQKLGP